MIKTHQNKVIGAYKITEKLSGEVLPLPMAYKFFKLKKALRSQYDFQVEQENLLVEQHGVEYKDGFLTFRSEEDQQSFFSRLHEIGSMEVEIDIDLEHVAISDDIRFSIEDMEMLEDFIVFE